MPATKSGSTIVLNGAGNTLATITSDIGDPTWIEESPAGTWTIKQKGMNLMGGAIFTIGNAGDFSVAEKLIFNNTASTQCNIQLYNDAKWYVYGNCELHSTQDPVSYYNNWYVYGKFHIEGDVTYKPKICGFYSPNFYGWYDIYFNDYNIFKNVLWQDMKLNGRFWTMAGPRRCAPFGTEHIENVYVTACPGGTNYGIYTGPYGADDTGKILFDNVTLDGFGTGVYTNGKCVTLRNCQIINSISRAAQFINGSAVQSGEYESDTVCKPGLNFGQYGFSFLEGCLLDGGSAYSDIYMADNGWLLIKDCDFRNTNLSIDVRYHGILWIWTGNIHACAPANPFGISNGLVYWVHALDLTVEDSEGSPLEDATILIKQKDGKELWQFRTDSNGRPKTHGALDGKIICTWRQQTTTVPDFVYWSDPSNSTYHDVWVWKEGYDWQKLQVVMNQDRTQTVQLPDLTPAVGDVEEGVDFGNATKTGTFVVPGQGKVQKAEQYGAGGTEFTGELDVVTLAGQNFKGHLQKKTNLKGRLQKKTNLKGKLNRI